MEVSPIQAVQASAADRSRTSLTNDFDNFLTLLTTQLSHQDPLDPVNSNEFVQQLVSFTGVEQAVNTNSNLEQLISLLKLDQSASAVGYLGKTVEAEGDSTVLAGGSATFHYALPENAESTTIQVINDQGKIVYSAPGPAEAGDHTLVWDGRDNNGVKQPDGTYRISVSARNADDDLLAATTKMSGKVTKVETVDGSIVLTVNGVGVPVDKVISVAETPPPPNASG